VIKQNEISNHHHHNFFRLVLVAIRRSFLNVLEGGPNFALVSVRLSGLVRGGGFINGVASLIKESWHQLSQEAWYQMKILVEGTHYELFIDDQQVVAYDWNGFTKGGIGIGARDVVTHFDDIRIYGDSVPNGGAFAVQPQGKLATTWGEMKRR